MAIAHANAKSDLVSERQEENSPFLTLPSFRIFLGENQLTSLPKYAFQILSKLTKYDFAEKRLSRNLHVFPNSLRLDRNNLSSLIGISNLQKLQRLAISRKCFSSFLLAYSTTFSLWLHGNKSLPSSFQENITANSRETRALLDAVSKYSSKPGAQPAESRNTATSSETDWLRQEVARLRRELQEERKTTQRLREGLKAAVLAHEQVVNAHNDLLNANEIAFKRVREDLADQISDANVDEKRQKGGV